MRQKTIALAVTLALAACGEEAPKEPTAQELSKLFKISSSDIRNLNCLPDGDTGVWDCKWVQYIDGYNTPKRNNRVKKSPHGEWKHAR